MTKLTLLHIMFTIRLYHLNITEAIIFLSISNTAGIVYQSDLLNLNFSPARLSLTVNKLIARGYLASTQDQRDARRHPLYLTNQGYDFIAQLQKEG